MSRLLYRLGGSAARRPWRMIGLWLAAVAVFSGLAAGFGGALHDDYTLEGTGSQQATDLLREHFPLMAGADARVVVRGDGPLDTAAVAAAGTRIAGLPRVAGVEDPRMSADGRTALITVRYDRAVTELAPKKDLALLEEAARVPGARSEFGGQVPENVSAPGGLSEALGVTAALVVLFLAFGSVIAAGLPLAVALTGLGVGVSGITVLAAFIDVSTTTPTLAVMIGLGVGIDYALFVLTRFRENLAEGMAVPEAVASAAATAGRSVLFAGLTVLFALCGLAFAGLPVFVTMGYATGLVVAATMASALTLLPALLGLAGRRVLRRRERRGAAVAVASPRIAAWAARVGRRPLPWLLAALTLLLALAAPTLALRNWPSDASSEPTSATVRQAYDLIADAYGPGANGPLVVALDLGEGADPAAVRDRLAGLPGVAAAAEPVVSPDGAAAALTVIPRFGPQDERVAPLVDAIRAQVRPEGGEVTGLTAAYRDISELIMDRLPVVVLVVVGTSCALLLLVFRSIAVPLKAAVMNLLSVGAAYGVVTALFQWGWGASALGLPHGVPVSSYVLPLMFAVLFGVSMDYEVFLLSRVREEYERTGDARGSVVAGLASTGRIITSAALIMIAVFAGFMLDPAVLIKQMGVGLAVAVAVDATLVRLVLVPATMALLGRANWWLPGPLARVLPAVRPRAAEKDGDALELVG
ncbi:RND superfamily putative drug exporter [Actinocorallia herbida]|uniref:RND superfamily putative drug exporter n=1 Tax=Actinocorallia herbida TaxID=58109 RepID=A0A3N1CQR2_9ACTN|nr:MMPL family transporter [Actinocorallia herbida]ROO83651.1 RND superfamily putative drug exporter [Actinocorallia herbida]